MATAEHLPGPDPDPEPCIYVCFDGTLYGAVTRRPWYLTDHLGRAIGERGPQVDGSYNPRLRFATRAAAGKAARKWVERI